MIKAYSAKTLFHESAWLDHILTIHPGGSIEYYEIRESGEPIGHHCGIRVRKMGVPIHGSPLGGTGTNFMGPMVRSGTDASELASALGRLVRFPFILHLELSNPELEVDKMETAGFSVQRGKTHLVEIGEEEESAWTTLRSTCRNRIRRAWKNELVVERASDETIAQEFYDQFLEVYGKQNLIPPFGPERPRSLFKHLFPAGRLLALRVKRGKELMATGLFPFDENCIYFWGGASRIRYHKLSPNELLHWEVIRFAVEKGIRCYNMCGGHSQFKDKFGGEDVPYLTFFKSALPGLGIARKVYRRYHFARLKSARGSRPLDNG